ncbi:MAG: YeeE/YedE family protein [Gammaproteobacteria bacterium]|nr:YeeE/YedE family protein [Gammaproteobacteria bacterium]
MIDWASFTPLSSLIGGVCIGLASVLLMAMLGRIAGISGITQGILWERDRLWRIAFIAGLVIAGGGSFYWLNQPFQYRPDFPLALTVAAGLLVGIGTSIGHGCTSGHGVCGLARVSKRSFVATAVFLITAMVTVFIVRHVASNGWSL